MKFFGILSTLLVSSVVAMPTPGVSTGIQKRDANAIIAAIDTLNADVIKLNDTVNKFNPASLTTLNGLLDVLKGSDQVGNDIINTTSQVNKTGPLNSDDSLNVGIEFINFVPNVQSLLQNLVAVRPKVDSVAVVFSARKTVLAALQNDLTLTNQLINAISANIDPGLAGVVPEVAGAVQGSFKDAIANYSKSMKGIELPAIPSNVRNGKVVNY